MHSPHATMAPKRKLVSLSCAGSDSDDEQDAPSGPCGPPKPAAKELHPRRLEQPAEEAQPPAQQPRSRRLKVSESGVTLVLPPPPPPGPVLCIMNMPTKYILMIDRPTQRERTVLAHLQGATGEAHMPFTVCLAHGVNGIRYDQGATQILARDVMALLRDLVHVAGVEDFIDDLYHPNPPGKDDEEPLSAEEKLYMQDVVALLGGPVAVLDLATRIRRVLWPRLPATLLEMVVVELE